MKYTTDWRSKEFVKDIFLGELCVSHAYDGADDDNYTWLLASKQRWENLRCLAFHLQCLMYALNGRAGFIGITSGIRCPKVNSAVGGVPSSRHLQGLAVDIIAGNCAAVIDLIQNSYELFFDKVIWYRDRRFIHLELSTNLTERTIVIKK